MDVAMTSPEGRSFLDLPSEVRQSILRQVIWPADIVSVWNVCTLMRSDMCKVMADDARDPFAFPRRIGESILGSTSAVYQGTYLLIDIAVRGSEELFEETAFGGRTWILPADCPYRIKKLKANWERVWEKMVCAEDSCGTCRHALDQFLTFMDFDLHSKILREVFEAQEDAEHDESIASAMESDYRLRKWNLEPWCYAISLRTLDFPFDGSQSWRSLKWSSEATVIHEYNLDKEEEFYWYEELEKLEGPDIRDPWRYFPSFRDVDEMASEAPTDLLSTDETKQKTYRLAFGGTYFMGGKIPQSTEGGLLLTYLTRRWLWLMWWTEVAEIKQKEADEKARRTKEQGYEDIDEWLPGSRNLPRHL